MKKDAAVLYAGQLSRKYETTPTYGSWEAVPGSHALGWEKVCTVLLKAWKSSSKKSMYRTLETSLQTCSGLFAINRSWLLPQTALPCPNFLAHFQSKMQYICWHYMLKKLTGPLWMDSPPWDKKILHRPFSFHFISRLHSPWLAVFFSIYTANNYEPIVPDGIAQSPSSTSANSHDYTGPSWITSLS